VAVGAVAARTLDVRTDHIDAHRLTPSAFGVAPGDMQRPRTAPLVKPGTSNAHAFLNGTEFTGPLVFITLWVIFVLMTLKAGRVRVAGAILMTLFALIYTIGNTAELFKSNVGLSSSKWDFVLAATGVGLVISVTTVVLGIGYLAKSRVARVT
jgi:hypothetical protein